MAPQLQIQPPSQLDAAQFRIQMGIDDEEMERRASLVGVGPEDRGVLQGLTETVDAHADEAAQAFVDFLATHPSARFLVRDDDAVAQCRASMADHLRTLVADRYDADYAQDRIETALLYARQNIEPKVFSAGFQRSLQSLGHALVDHLGAQAGFRGFGVIQKLASMDLALMLDVLFWDRARTLQNYQQTVMELSTPVQQVWDGILMAPIVGTLDTARAQQVMERLLEAIETHEASFAIIDISGVPTVDTSVAQNLLKTIHAARLMGTRTILSGVRPEIASTMVHFGVELGEVSTQRTMREALKMALSQLGRHEGPPRTGDAAPGVVPMQGSNGERNGSSKPVVRLSERTV